MESLIMDKHFSFGPNFQLSHAASSSSIGEEEDGNESFDDDDEVNSLTTSPLQDMSCLLQHLPFKRGLSKHYNGKSQSFTSLLSVATLEDLAKRENPLNKKLKTCKSYAVFPRSTASSSIRPPPTSSTNVSSSPGFATNSSFCCSTNSCNDNYNKPPI